ACGSARGRVSALFFFFFSSRRRHTRSYGDWSSDVCSSDLHGTPYSGAARPGSIGPLLPNTECRVVDPASGSDLGPGEDGELWIQIGRASCRERGEMSVGGGACEKEETAQEQSRRDS